MKRIIVLLFLALLPIKEVVAYDFTPSETPFGYQYQANYGGYSGYGWLLTGFNAWQESISMVAADAIPWNKFQPQYIFPHGLLWHNPWESEWIYWAMTANWDTTPFATNMTYDFWKIKIWEEYFCLYDRGITPTGNFAGKFVIDTNPRSASYSCPSSYHWYELVNLAGGNPPTAPTNPPLSSIINGLQCVTTKFPVFSNAYWYNFGGLDNHVVYAGQQNGRNFLEYEGTSNDGTSKDSVVLNDTLSGATLPILSIEYPWSQYANVDLKTSEQAGIIVQAKRGGSKVPWNILQFYGTNSEGFAWWGRGCIVSSNWSTLCDPDPIESSWWIATLSTLLSDGSYWVTGIIKYPVSWFSGIRMGLAPMAPLTECSSQNNKCQFKPIGNNWKCSPVVEGGVEVWVCGLAWSWSIYWSGACVPLTDWSGAIIQTTLPWQYTTITNPDGTTTSVRIPDGYNDWSSVFSCDVPESLSWHEALGQYAICPFVTIPTKIYKKITTPFKTVEDNIYINKIDTRIYTWATGLVGSGAILSQNPLLLQFKSNLDSIGTDTQHPWWIWLRFAFALAVFAIILLVIGTYIWLLKKG